MFLSGSAGHKVHDEPLRTRHIFSGWRRDLCASFVLVVTLPLSSVITIPM